MYFFVLNFYFNILFIRIVVYLFFIFFCEWFKKIKVLKWILYYKLYNVYFKFKYSFEKEIYRKFFLIFFFWGIIYVFSVCFFGYELFILIVK